MCVQNMGRPFVVGQTVWTNCPEQPVNHSRAACVLGYNSLGEAVLEANDKKPWHFRGSDRRVLDFPLYHVSRSQPARPYDIIKKYEDYATRGVSLYTPEVLTDMRALMAAIGRGY